MIGAGIATWRKAPDLFIEAAIRSFADSGPRDRFVWIGGEHDDLFPRLLAEAQRCCPESLRFIGNVDDVVPWLAAADVLLHPARLDAFPLVCLHSALAGTPVVGFSGTGGLPEMFGGSFVGAPYPDLSGLVRSLETMRDPATRAAVAQAQCEQVRAVHTTDMAAHLVLAHLQRAAQASTP
ncbi:MAG: glycosyltransferase [Microthrixaceae bacterium]|nr:glycosyltransferase [Microthrixaceae bacterium]